MRMVPSLLASTQAAGPTAPTPVTKALSPAQVATPVAVTTTMVIPAVVTLLAVTPVMSTNLSRDGQPGLALSGDQPY